MKLILISSILAMTVLFSTGCSPKGHAPSTVGQNMTVEKGVVQSVKKVEMDTVGVGNVLGGIVGSVAGGSAGAHVGGGTGQIVASVLGVAVGSVLGGTVGDKIDTDYGQEVIVKLNNGKTIATILRIDGATAELHVGESVNVFMSGGKISNISKE